MEFILESNRLRLLEARCLLSSDPWRLVKSVTVGALNDSRASLEIPEPGRYGLDLTDVHGVDVASGESINLPVFSIGCFDVTEADFESGRKLLDTDQSSFVDIEVLDSNGTLRLDREVSVVLPGRTCRINLATQGNRIGYLEHDGWIVVEGMESEPIPLPRQSGDRVQTIRVIIPAL